MTSEETEGNIEQRVEKVESEIKQISTDLSSVVSELKKSIVDVRSAVSEIENPFNLLRAVSSEKDMKNLNNERTRLRMKTLTLGKPKEQEQEQGNEVIEPPSLPLSLEEDKPTEKMPPPPSTKTGFGHLKWVWSLLDLGLTPKGITQLSEYCEHIGYLPPNSSEYISFLAHVADRAKMKGLSKEQLMMSMYEAAVASGVEVKFEDMSEIVSVAIKEIKTPVRTE
ncbi:MAG: hypothetical protein OEX77_05610 [Candidatus Bathyarchaeota archaeon]|nr:hypothetical protein [Candidatus Bathyarchaeota archaeon]MDH5733520.1 hypothetical protein [Candidatus Bathyarchaeota archaeon]